ncbi:hypothetical protein [Pseudomonas sp. GZD-209]|uniref:hypothetical protein n=1 Tax=Pseudomonas sp. GZD-209 TaxID=3404807 RepID=UPI003BB6EF30
MWQVVHYFYLASLIVFITSQVQLSEPGFWSLSPAERKGKSKVCAKGQRPLESGFVIGFALLFRNELTPIKPVDTAFNFREGVVNPALTRPVAISLQWSAFGPRLSGCLVLLVLASSLASQLPQELRLA